MSELPNGWAVAALPELIGADGVFSDGDWVETKDQDPDGDIRLTQLADIGEGSWRNRSERYMTADAARRLGCTQLKPGDVLVARMPDPLGRACIFPGDPRPCVTAVDVCIIRPGPGSVDPHWLMWWLNTPQIRAEVVARQAGTTRKRISRKNLATILLPIPPLAEQGRILAAIEEQLSRLEAAEAQVGSVRKALVTLRETLLRSAFDRVTKRVELHEVADVVSGQTPKGLTTLSAGPIPFYKVGDMNDAAGDEMGVSRTYLDEKLARRHRVRVRPAGTVVFPKRGGAIATDKKRILAAPAAFDLNTMGVVPGERLLPRYLLAWFKTVDLASIADGSNVPQINHDDVAYLSVPVAPLEEQERVISVLDKQLSGLAAVEKGCAALLSRAAALRSAILATAFRGELVAHSSDDEPSIVLLERIAAERAAVPKPTRRQSHRAIGAS